MYAFSMDNKQSYLIYDDRCLMWRYGRIDLCTGIRGIGKRTQKEAAGVNSRCFGGHNVLECHISKHGA